MNKKEEAPNLKHKEKESRENLNQMLIENFVHLQRVMSNMAEKFDKLSDNISRLLGLFETTARSFMSSPAIADTEKDREFLDKLNALLEQNKTIAKGLTLMEEKFRERVYGQRESQEMPMISQNPLSSLSQQSQAPIKRLPRF